MFPRTRYAQPPRTLKDFLTPYPQYLPLSDIAFGPSQIVMGYELPPSNMVFPNPTFNKMLNIPGQNAQTIYDYNRTGAVSA